MYPVRQTDHCSVPQQTAASTKLSRAKDSVRNAVHESTAPDAPPATEQMRQVKDKATREVHKATASPTATVPKVLGKIESAVDSAASTVFDAAAGLAATAKKKVQDAQRRR